MGTFDVAQIGGVAVPLGTADGIAGVPAAGLYVWNGGTTWNRVQDATQFNDGRGSGILSANSFVFNGTNYDRQRGNQPAVTAINATGVSSNQTSADIINYNFKGIIAFLNITAITAGSVGLNINNKDDISGNYSNVLTGTTQAGTGEFMYIIYPGETVSPGLDLSQVLSRTFQIVAPVVTGPATFKINYCLIL